MLRVLLFAAAVASAGACKPVVDVANPSPFDEDDPMAGSSANDMRQGGTEVASEVEPQVEVDIPGPAAGTVNRAALIAVLDAGPGRLLEGILLDPKLDLRNKFVGWVVVQFPYKWADIREGDVIIKINGHPLGRPDQVQKLWDSLRDADSIFVKGERDDMPLQLKFEVVDDEPRTAGP